VWKNIRRGWRFSLDSFYLSWEKGLNSGYVVICGVVSNPEGSFFLSCLACRKEASVAEHV
jgi:hypothetical protein